MIRRISPEASTTMRAAIREAGGVEVFAIGDVADEVITAVTITCRGQADRVNALVDRPRKGQVVIHNHPSGDLRPSDADMSLAGRYGENGVGFVIVDSDARKMNVVIEPAEKGPVCVGEREVERFFREILPATMPGWEPREPQIAMAKRVVGALDQGTPLLIEAGTGTGKSLAYLVPSALWALANDGRVVIATHTRALQAQLMSTDLPVLRKAGLDLRAALLEGRGNYVCRRRLELAQHEPEEALRAEIAALRDWSDTEQAASRSSLSFRVSPEAWDAVLSDGDLSLRHQCEHYDVCHYYTARRNAAGAHVIIVNHALLMVDLSVKAEGGTGILPKYERLILDEAQHVEDVATGALSHRVTPLAVRRAISSLRPGSRSRASLTRLTPACRASKVPPEVEQAVGHAASEADALVGTLYAEVDDTFANLADPVAADQPALRIKAEYESTDAWRLQIKPVAERLASLLQSTAASLAAIRDALGEHTIRPEDAQAFLDVDRAQRRLVKHTDATLAFLTDSPDSCRWMEQLREQNNPSLALSAAPIDVAASLRKVLWDVLPGVVATSATLSVAGDFRFWRERHGLEASDEAVFPSPFDHYRNALLGVPRDLPAPDQPGYLEASARITMEAIHTAGGGAFVLCTSVRAVREYAEACRRGLPPHIPVLAQGDAARPILLDRFRELQDAVLVGTDSFWEGVSVKGDGLRLVVIPRLPFRVPTEPLQQARHERIAAQGGDPFKALTLPQAVLKLRQGYGRLIRSTTDRGVVLLLDRRVIDKSYGRVVLAALPPARRLSAPWARVREEMHRFYAERPPVGWRPPAAGRLQPEEPDTGPDPWEGM